MRDDVAAVLLSWNDGERVAALIERLAALAPAPGHVIVVDNGSDEETRRRISLPGVDVVALERNFGFAAAANRGIERALSRGAEWAWLLNTDVELPADALAALLAGADAEPRAGMIAALLVEADGTLQARGGGRVNLWTGVARHVTGATERCDYLSGACLLLHASMLRQIGLFDEGYFFYWEDVDLSFRAREAGWKLVVAGGCRVLHHEGSSLGRWSSQRWFHLFRGMRRFLDRRAPYPRLATALRLVLHSATMLRHGRVEAVRGAWRGAGRRPR